MSGKMHIDVLEHSEADLIAREDASDGEFYMRLDGSIWYRNALSAGSDLYVNSGRSEFLRAVDALHRYNRNVVAACDEEGQMACVRLLAADLRSVGALCGPESSFWPLIVEQAEHGLA